MLTAVKTWNLKRTLWLSDWFDNPTFPQVSICSVLMLGCQAAPGSSIEFSPEVTTYSLPVPVFGDTSAVEGVLTAARHTEAEGLAGTYCTLKLLRLRYLRLSRRWRWVLFWVVTPCTLVGTYTRFGETYCFHPQVSTKFDLRHQLAVMSDRILSEM
jgi:hypothetical protein